MLSPFFMNGVRSLHTELRNDPMELRGCLAKYGFELTTFSTRAMGTIINRLRGADIIVTFFGILLHSAIDLPFVLAYGAVLAGLGLAIAACQLVTGIATLPFFLIGANEFASSINSIVFDITTSLGSIALSIVELGLTVASLVTASALQLLLEIAAIPGKIVMALTGVDLTSSENSIPGQIIEECAKDRFFKEADSQSNFNHIKLN